MKIDWIPVFTLARRSATARRHRNAIIGGFLISAKAGIQVPPFHSRLNKIQKKEGGEDELA
jgi:hypothetical protein